MTVVAPLNGDETAIADLARWIETEIDPGWIEHSSESEGFSDAGQFFSALPGLHCCAFLILPAVQVDGETLDACLVMEATFDGQQDDFLADLVRANLAELTRIFGHCVGFPTEGAMHRQLVNDYIARHTVAHNAYFSGAPGRTIGEIRTEQRMRTKLEAHLQDEFAPDANRPRARMLDIQRELRQVVRDDDSLRMVEERPTIPWSVRNGGRVMQAVAAVFAVVLGLVGWAAGSLFGLDSQSVFAWLGRSVFDADTGGLLIAGAIAIGLIWFPASVLHACVFPLRVARERRGPWQLVTEMTGSVMFAGRALLVAVAAIFWLRFAEGAYNDPDFRAGDELIVLALTAAALILRIPFGLAKGMAWRAGAFEALPPGAEAMRLAWIRLFDMARLLLWLVAYTVVLIPLALLLPTGLWPMLLLGLHYLGVASVFVLIGWAIFLLLKLAVMGASNVLHDREDQTYRAADILTRAGLDPGDAKDREEHRTQMRQNHFASVTLVKNPVRRLLLRLSLTLVNVLARYVDNKGTLGGIPTIFSARWVLLDNGRRLLFMTNYVGAWDSYLGEFSDLDAFLGVNAIWSNTYLQLTPKAEDQLTRIENRAAEPGPVAVGFPRTHWILWGGASYEHPFKAYVRHSQIRTLAWYGAYPDLSVPNINNNSELRDKLFRKLGPSELDRLFRLI